MNNEPFPRGELVTGFHPPEHIVRASDQARYAGSSAAPPGAYGGVPNIDGGIKAIIIGAAAKAGQNHWQASRDPGRAVEAAGGALVRWTAWATVFVLWWVIIFVSMLNSTTRVSYNTSAEAVAASNGDLSKVAWVFVIAPWTLGVTWVRNIDYCLFRRGLIYRFFAPIAHLVEWCPSFILYLMILFPVIV